jgi:hypothetical protein
MSNNPYAHPSPYEAGYVEPQRLSIAAVTSFVCSLICCIPGVGLFGAILGVFSLFRISSAQGRLTGKGLAIAGIVLGLLVTLLWLGILVGFATTLRQFSVYGDTLRALHQRDYNQFRLMLTPAASAAAPDTRLEEFRAEVYAEWGEFQALPQGLVDWLTAYGQLGGLINQQQQQSRVTGEPLPIPAYFDNGLTLVIFMLDPRAVSPVGAAQFSNLAVLDQAGNPIWLLPPAQPLPPPPPPPSDPVPTPPPEETPDEDPGE